MSRAESISELRSKLSPEKLALLDKLKNEKMITRASGIQRRLAKGPIPLSFAQQRLWFLDQLVPNSPAYNVIMAWRLSGKVKAEILERCINEIVQRHEILRTTFPSINGEPYQAISPTLTLTLPVVDLMKYPESEREAEFRRMAKEEARYIFDLSQGPLLRGTLFCLDKEKHILLLNVHHIIIDGWSVGVFLNELIALYIAFSADKPSPLPELSIQYADFSSWQRQWMQGEVLKAQLAYWKAKLGEEKNVLELPADRVRPPIQTFQGGSLSFQLSPSLASSIKALSEQKDATLYMVLTTALKILLHRYTGQNDIIVGAPIANRNKVEIENLIGFFVNSLVLKTDLSGNPSFLELLERERAVANDAYKHQDVPFEVMVDQLQPERNMSQNPLFQVCIVLQNLPMPSKSNIDDLDFYVESLEEIRNDTAKFDLWLEVKVHDDVLDIDVEYNSDIFNESTITRLLESYKILLEGIVANPNQHISELPILPAEEQYKLLVEWNDTGVDYSQKHMCLHQIIEHQVMQTPDAPAVIFEEKQLTYKELDQRANQLANYLRKLDVRPETLVGICMERSLEMVVGLLGVLKAGGAYVPLDPTYPPDRIVFMMNDANLPLLLTQRKLLNILPEFRGTMVCLDSDWEILDKESHRAEDSGVTKENLAYMIYTSGSTGKPKGVMNTHQGIVNRLLWMQEEYQLNRDDRILQKTPFSFDVSVWEFFWPLVAGACLVVARPEGHKDTSYLASIIKKEKITTIHFVPSMLQAFLEEKEIEDCETLKRVICSGEALAYSTQERFFERLQAKLHNLYGPTEAAVDVTYWACQKGSTLRFVPIGRPIENTQIYILDKYLNPVPVGVPGEMHIGGIQLARGYYKRPELTNEKFIPNPFSKEKGTRLYKTGDLARYLPDGNIEFLGRIDFQVKLRGFRIELGEIEAVLEEYPGVQKAAVMAREFEHMPEHKQLVAYIIPDQEIKGEAESEPAAELSTVQVLNWQEVFDKAYDMDNTHRDADFNISSWNSSYTGLPLLEEEMREWVDSTVNRILNLKPKRVLEIGCGTGLLLSRIAPYCEQYWGTDISSTALDYIRNHLTSRRENLSHVKLFKKNANDFKDFEGQEFDVVILNSVVQYFSDINYLVSVLKKSVQLVKCGSIFVGDIRSFPLLQAFHADVEMAKVQNTLSIEQFMRRVSKRVQQDQELVIDPEFFQILQNELPSISFIETHLKRGNYHNELTRYRYDAVLYIGEKTDSIKDILWLDWQKDNLNLNKFRDILINQRLNVIGVTNIPNKRLHYINQGLLLMREENFDTVNDLKQGLCQEPANSCIDPEEMWSLGDQLQYKVDLTWVDGKTNGSYQAIFRNKCIPDILDKIIPMLSSSTKSRAMEECVNDPLSDKIIRWLVPQLRSYLKERLPDYMIPTTFMVLKYLPVTSNGKLDRDKLPVPILEVPEMEENFILPITPVEKQLAEIWAEVLGLEQVGTRNNFFELGGDSIQSIQVIARAKLKGIPLTTQHIFQYQTIYELAEALSHQDSEGTRQLDKLDNNTPAENSNFGITAKIDHQTLTRIQSQIPDIEDIYPLTVMQENMLYQYLNFPQPGLNVVSHVFLINGEQFDVSAFERSWQCVIKQFPALRTSFVWKDLEEPLQIVHKEVDLYMERHDLRALSPNKREEQIKLFIQELRNTGFKLDQAPHTRMILFQVADNVYYFVYAFNLMLQDGWSYPLILKTFSDYYKAFLDGKEIKLQPKYFYRDYINWQQQQDLSGAEIFWKNKLKNVSLPTPKWTLPKSELIQNQGANYFSERLSISEEVMKALSNLSKQHHLTIYSIVQGAWAMLLSKYTDQSEVVFGSIFSGRSISLPEIENGVGLFFNILPMRVEINQYEHIVPWLQGIQAKSIETSLYEATPLRNIYSWCGISRNRLLFESYLVSERLPNFEATIKEVNDIIGFSTLDWLAQTEHPLRVEVHANEQSLMVAINYYQRYFRENEVKQMLSDLNRILEELAINPEQKLGDLMFSIKKISETL